jgi:hypothetical protein
VAPHTLKSSLRTLFGEKQYPDLHRTWKTGLQKVERAYSKNVSWNVPFLNSSSGTNKIESGDDYMKIKRSEYQFAFKKNDNFKKKPYLIKIQGVATIIFKKEKVDANSVPTPVTQSNRCGCVHNSGIFTNSDSYQADRCHTAIG